MKVAMIWAMARNRVIGRDGDLPWRLPKDMRHFMRTTRGHPVIMGRRTFESMAGKPLPDRVNIVVTGRADYPAPGAEVAASLQAALALAADACPRLGVDTAFIIGGAGLYQAGFAVADRLYVTEVDAEVAGDTFFPDVDWSDWREVSREACTADGDTALPFTITVYDRP